MKNSRHLFVLSLMIAACSSSHPTANTGSGGTGGGPGGDAGAAGGQGGGTSLGTGGNNAGGSTGGAGNAGTGGDGTAGAGGGNNAGTGGSTGAGTGGSTGATGIGGSTGTGAGGSTGATGTGGSTGATGTGGSSSVDGGADAACQTVNYKFNSSIPTVFVLVDRSGSEFGPLGPDAGPATTGTYFTLRTATLQVIDQLQGQVRFGFGAFVGSHATGTCLPVFDSVPIAINNSAAIAAEYNSIDQLLPPGSKADTPASAVIPMVKAALQADTGTGSKYMLFVTDGETDFCDDGDTVCPTDGVTYELQNMYAAGIGTLIIGLPSSLTTSTAPVLQGFANAGAGQPVTLPTTVTSAVAISSRCSLNQGWSSLAATAGRAGTGIATYAAAGAAGGTATVFAPTTASQDMLAQQITAAVAGIKSCAFNLSNLDGSTIQVDLTRLGNAHVAIGGTPIALDAANGWSMSTPTVLVLNGAACVTWKTPGNDNITFDFPCDSFQ